MKNISSVNKKIKIKLQIYRHYITVAVKKNTKFSLHKTISKITILLPSQYKFYLKNIKLLFLCCFTIAYTTLLNFCRDHTVDVLKLIIFTVTGPI
jgi:hypothetical protein